MTTRAWGSVGGYLETLTPIEEHRLLTRHFEPISATVRAALRLPPRDLNRQPCGCLQMTAHDVGRWYQVGRFTDDSAGYRYEYLCFRFGVERVNRAIRNRILRNQLRRTNREVPQCVTV